MGQMKQHIYSKIFCPIFEIYFNPLLCTVAPSELSYEAQKKENNNFLRWGAVGVNNFYRINLFVCIMCVYLPHTIMRRFNFFIEQKWIDRIKRDMKKHGFTSVSSFIRHIIIKFFDKKF